MAEEKPKGDLSLLYPLILIGLLVFWGQSFGWKRVASVTPSGSQSIVSFSDKERYTVDMGQVGVAPDDQLVWIANPNPNLINLQEGMKVKVFPIKSLDLERKIVYYEICPGKMPDGHFYKFKGFRL